VNLHYFPDIETVFMYEHLKLDKTTLDLTVYTLDDTLIDNINTQIDNTDIKFRIM
jgi:hypothetical protein